MFSTVNIILHAGATFLPKFEFSSTFPQLLKIVIIKLQLLFIMNDELIISIGSNSSRKTW